MQRYILYTLTSITWFDFTVVVTIAGISLKAGRILQKLDYVTERISVLETKLTDIEKNLYNNKIRRQRLK